MVKKINKPSSTDWDSYYDQPFPASSITRSITSHYLVSEILRHVNESPIIIEYGGANSCFYNSISSNVNPTEYHIVDTNLKGLNHFKSRNNDSNVFLHHSNAINFSIDFEADLCFSVGLIEHFNETNTKNIIQNHFKNVKSGGYVIITFPTPTWLYRVTRRLAEILDLWIFHDERPLSYSEVKNAVCQYGEIIEQKLIWPIFLTQYHIVVRKN